MNTPTQLPFNQKIDELFPFPNADKRSSFTIEVDWQLPCGLDSFALIYKEQPTTMQVMIDLIDEFYSKSIDRKFGFKHVRLHASLSVLYYRLSQIIIDHCMKICLTRESNCKHRHIEKQRFGYSCANCRAFYDFKKYTFHEIKGIIPIEINNYAVNQ